MTFALRRRPRNGGSPAAGGVGGPDAGACKNRPGGRRATPVGRADDPRGDVSGPAAVQERPHRRRRSFAVFLDLAMAGPLVADSRFGKTARCRAVAAPSLRGARARASERRESWSESSPPGGHPLRPAPDTLRAPRRASPCPSRRRWRSSPPVPGSGLRLRRSPRSCRPRKTLLGNHRTSRSEAMQRDEIVSAAGDSARTPRLRAACR